MVGSQGVDNVTTHDYQGPPRIRRGWVTRAVGGAVAAAVIGLQLMGCQRAANATLTERASKYWQLKQQKRWEEVYDGYLDPALKGALPKDAFLKVSPSRTQRKTGIRVRCTSKWMPICRSVGSAERYKCVARR